MNPFQGLPDCLRRITELKVHRITRSASRRPQRPKELPEDKMIGPCSGSIGSRRGFSADPQVAQVIPGGIAASTMTVVSIVFAILLMTLTLASMQFSPRILTGFARDRVTQWTLGVFLGAFSYCMAALPAARSIPYPFSPVATVLGAMILAFACVCLLLFFIHHISQAISVNDIVDRIASETEIYY